MNTDLMKSELVFEVRPESLFQMLFPLETQSSNLYLFVHYQKQNMHQRLVNQLKSFHYNLFPFLFTSSVYFCEHDILFVPSFPCPAVHILMTFLICFLNMITTSNAPTTTNPTPANKLPIRSFCSGLFGSTQYPTPFCLFTTVCPAGQFCGKYPSRLPLSHWNPPGHGNSVLALSCSTHSVPTFVQTFVP